MAFFEETSNKEELYDVLTAAYDVEEKTALIIIENLESRHRLSESEEILLLSHEIPQEFLDYIQQKEKAPLVGPFFYINKKLFCHSVALKDFQKDVRFFNDPISHLEFFDTLNIDGDYGNFPRGRVIFDNLHKKFLVYLDKDLMTEGIKSSIMLAYHLKKGQIMFKRDIHYTYDGL